MIQFMEELSFNAWPALQNLYYDGWLLRFGDGYTRRANSVNPIYQSTRSVTRKIDYCEAMYRERGQRTVFKMTEAAQPSELDSILEERGYVEDARTSVQTRSLMGIPMPSEDYCTIDRDLTDEWLDAYCRINQVSDKRRDTLRQILLKIVPKTGYIAARIDDTIVAVGLGVIDAEYLGIYNLITDEAVRRQGIGTELVLHLLDWGLANAAQSAYLQVMLNNQSALNMYERLGFREQYQYWYRVQS